jgi:hypothetical protein
MADIDLNQKDATLSVKLVGADSNGIETNFADVSNFNELKAADTLNNGALDTIINVSTTAVEGKVGVTRLAGRKYVWFQALSVPNTDKFILWGFSNTTQSFKIFKDQILCFPIGENTQVWFKTTSGSGQIAFGEGR